MLIVEIFKLIIEMINMRSNEVLDEIQLRKYLIRVYSMLTLTIFSFFLGIALQVLGQVENLKISIIVVICFAMIFIFKTPCYFQYLCLLSISLIQGVLFSAVFIFQQRTSYANLCTGILGSFGIIICIFFIMFHCDKKCKQAIASLCPLGLWVFIVLIMLLKVAKEFFWIDADLKVILMFMITNFVADVEAISSSTAIGSRNYILDALLLALDVFQVFIRSLLILNNKV